MAKVQLGSVVTGIRGSVGGMTFSQGRDVRTVRGKARPVRRVRHLQPENRNILGFVAREWGLDLTDAQRALWKDYANQHPRVNQFGESYRMSGFNAYTSLNTEITRIFGVNNMIDSPPVIAPPASLLTLVASDGLVDGSVVLTWTMAGTGVVGDAVEVQISKVAGSPGQSAEIQSFTYVAKTSGNVLTKTLSDLVVEGWYWFRARYVDATGQTTGWLYVQYQAPDIA